MRRYRRTMRFLTAIHARWKALGPDRQDLRFGLLLGATGVLEATVERTHDNRAASALTAVVLGGAVVIRRRHPIIAIIAVNVGLIGGALLGGFALNAGISAVLCAVIVAYSVGAYTEGRQLWTGVAIQLVGFTIQAIAFAANGDVVGNVFFSLLMACGIPVTAGVAIRNRRRLGVELRNRSEELVAERERRARGAVAAERARIAGELHDVVSHNVSVMVVQAGAARRLVATDPTRASEAMLAIETTGRAALEEMRRMLGVLRRGDEELALAPQPTLQRVDRLVELARQDGLDASLLVEGDAVELPLGLDVAAYRIIQEALASARAHAPGAQAQVVVRYGRSDLELEVVNGAGAQSAGAARPASVLVGLRERVALFGGDLNAGRRRGGGYALRARLPLVERAS